MIIQYGTPKTAAVWNDYTKPISESGKIEFSVNLGEDGTFYTIADVYSGVTSYALPITFYPDGATSLFFGLLSVNAGGEISISFYTADGSAASAAASSILWRVIE